GKTPHPNPQPPTPNPQPPTPNPQPPTPTEKLFQQTLDKLPFRQLKPLSGPLCDKFYRLLKSSYRAFLANRRYFF
ncbi:MAG: hypothetical protein ACK544_00540, partial [Microcystis sp.]